MSRYHYGPPGAGAASLGMYGHLGRMRESRGPAPYGAASYGMYGGKGGGMGGGDYHRSVRSGAPSPSSSLFGSLRSRFSSSGGGYGSSYGSSSSGSSYDSRRSWMTDYKPRGGWFASRHSGSDYPPFPSDFQSRNVSRRRSYPGRSGW